MRAISEYLDAAVLKPEWSRDEALQAIKACLELKTRTVCVRPCDIELATTACRGTQTGVCVVLGFPHGCQLTASKVDEARRYVEADVDEIDMVANYGWVNSGLWDEVLAEITAVSAVTRPAGIPLKVIFEIAQINPESIGKLTSICIEAGADFVKTSTGFNGHGATHEGVEAMLTAAAGRIRVKPSGGIRNRADAEVFIKMGVHRLGVNWAACRAICEGDQTPVSDDPY
jgi:deoxyribose-phosphate aldolase